jgi:hypothetical protein
LSFLVERCLRPSWVTMRHAGQPGGTGEAPHTGRIRCSVEGCLPCASCRPCTAPNSGTTYGQGKSVDRFSPSLAGDQELRRFVGRYEQASASLGAAQALLRMSHGIDVRVSRQAEIPHCRMTGASYTFKLKLHLQRPGGSLGFLQHVSDRALAVDARVP